MIVCVHVAGGALEAGLLGARAMEDGWEHGSEVRNRTGNPALAPREARKERVSMRECV